MVFQINKKRTLLFKRWCWNNQPPIWEIKIKLNPFALQLIQNSFNSQIDEKAKYIK